MLKGFIKVVFWLVVYVGSIGFIIPELISAKSNFLVISGILLILVLVYRAITFIPIEKIKEFIKEMFN